MNDDASVIFNFVPVNLQGHGQSYDEIFVFGSMDVTLPKFCAVYRRGKRLIAACAVNCDKLIVEMSLALQNQVEWQTEFPTCLTSRFPHEPVQGRI